MIKRIFITALLTLASSLLVGSSVLAAGATVEGVNDQGLAVSDGSSTQASGIILHPYLSGSISNPVTLKATLDGKMSNLKISTGASLVFTPDDVKKGTKKEVDISISGTLTAGQSSILTFSGSGIQTKTITVSTAPTGTTGGTGSTTTPPKIGSEPTIDPSSLPGSKLSLSDVIGLAVQWFSVIIALTAFFGIIYSGFQYITAGGDTSKTEKARKNIGWALTGVLIAGFAYVIVRAIAGFDLTGASLKKTPSSSGSSTTTNSGSSGKSGTSSGGSTTGQGGSGQTGTGTTGSGTSSTAPSQILVTDSSGTMQNNTLTLTSPSQTFNNPYGFQLDRKPDKDVTITVTTTGDLPISLSDTTLTFTPDNYATIQGINVRYNGGGKPGQSSRVTLTGSDGSKLVLTFTIQS